MKMLKYYIGLSILMVFTFGMAAYVAAMSGDAKDDKLTSERALKIAPMLDAYVSEKGQLPSNLSEIPKIGDVPSTITYTKISVNQYKFCLNYRNASSGFDGGWGSLFYGAMADQQSTSDDQGQDSSYLNVYGLVYQHKKGENCQTVKAYIQSNIYDDYCNTAPTSVYCRGLNTPSDSLQNNSQTN